MGLNLNRESDFNYYYNLANTYKTDYSQFLRTLAKNATGASNEVSGISFGGVWEDDAATKFEGFLNNSLKTAAKALDPANGATIAFSNAIEGLESALLDCKDKKDEIDGLRADLAAAPKQIKNPDYDPNATTSYYGSGFYRTLEYIQNPDLQVIQNKINAAYIELDQLIANANAYISTLGSITFDPEATISADGDKGADASQNGGDASSGDNTQTAERPTTFKENGLAGMTEQDAYPDGNLNHGAYYYAQVTDLNGEKHDVMLHFNGNSPSPSDPSSWSLSQIDPSTGTSTWYSTSYIGFDEIGNYQIQIYDTAGDGSVEDFCARFG